jgi:hypothetical protein
LFKSWEEIESFVSKGEVNLNKMAIFFNLGGEIES